MVKPSCQIKRSYADAPLPMSTVCSASLTLAPSVHIKGVRIPCMTEADNEGSHMSPENGQEAHTSSGGEKLATYPLRWACSNMNSVISTSSSHDAA